MKAAQINNYGGVEEIEINPGANKPQLKPGQVLVEVRSASLNRIDTYLRMGNLKDMLPLQFPIILGGDFSGTVVEAADDVTTLKFGDEVYGNAGQFKGGSGTLANYAAANAKNVAIKPKAVGFNEAASLPLVASSALQAIEEHLDLQPGQKILIQGGAGGIGSIAIQLAKLKGAHVATTVAVKDMAFVKNLGADEVFDYKTQDVSKLLKEYDAVYDTAGGEGANKLLGVLKKGGKLVSMAGQPDAEMAKNLEVTAMGQMTIVSSEQLQKIATLVNEGKLLAQIDKTFGLEQTREAYEYFEWQHPKGKVVVIV